MIKDTVLLSNEFNVVVPVKGGALLASNSQTNKRSGGSNRGRWTTYSPSSNRTYDVNTAEWGISLAATLAGASASMIDRKAETPNDQRCACRHLQ